MKQLCAALIVGAHARGTPTPAVPLEPVAAMVDAFRTHAVVAVTAGHGEVARLCLRAAAHSRSAPDRRHQRHRHRRGERPVSGRRRPLRPRRERADGVAPPRLARHHPAGARLRSAVGGVLHQAMRGINASLPAARKVRVLLGDPPIEWEKVKTPEEHRQWIEMRDTFPADLIQREVLAKGRHALLTYGPMHFQRKNLDRELRIGRAGGNHRQPAGEQVGREGLHDLHRRRLGAAAGRPPPGRHRAWRSFAAPCSAPPTSRILPVRGDGPVPDQGRPARFLRADSERAMEDAPRRGSVRRRSSIPARSRRRGSTSIRPLRRQSRVRGAPAAHDRVRHPGRRRPSG